MPKSYSEKEREQIIKELKKAALESLITKGVKKTTVDDLVAKVHIPKGTFYLFYTSKEMLLFDSIMETEARIHEQLGSALEKTKSDFSVESLSTMLYDFFILGFNSGFIQLMVSGELDVLIRKLPDDLVAEHIKKDDDFLIVFKLLFPQITEERLKDYSDAFRALFFTATYKREIGENYEEVLKLLIKALVSQMWSESIN